MRILRCTTGNLAEAVRVVDDAEHLKRLSKNKRGDLLAGMRNFPKQGHLRHPVTFVLVGTAELSEAVAECGEVRRIDVPAMALDGPGGTFDQVCRPIFGAQRRSTSSGCTRRRRAPSARS